MLSASEFKRAQRNFRFFIFFNVISFTLVTGNIMQLYALRLGAGLGLLGFIASLNSLTFLFSILGRRLIPKMGVVRVQGVFWIVRYVLMAPILLLIFPALRAQKQLVFGLLILGNLGFNVFKGMALAAHRPLLGSISKDEDRATFLSGNLMINFTVSMATGLLMAFLLGKDSPLYMYTIFIAVGITAGITGAFMVIGMLLALDGRAWSNDHTNGHSWGRQAWIDRRAAAKQTFNQTQR